MLLQMAFYHSFLWLSNSPWHAPHLYPFIVSGHLDCFHALAIVSSAAMNTGVCLSFWIMVFFRYVPRSGIARSWSLVACSPWGREESDTTERLHFPLSCFGEGNGNPLQCSCLENPTDGEA